ncbi:alpha/beta hydrolase [Actinoplanes sp. NPDC020271]|uniref:alpha/beta hydrolase n=1 Tax=Actinoplanes sp. NPDC020271 TaxID=3363896 RepID=UPI00378ED09D
MAVALLIPGGDYSAERPLLHFAGEVFAKHGWRTRAVRWPSLLPPRGDDFALWNRQLRSYVHQYLSQLLGGEPDRRVALAGKSMGCFAAALAADRGLPAVWLTPVLRDSELPGDLQRATAPFLLLGGTADPTWAPAIARGLGRPFFEAANADHRLAIPGDPVRSVEVLRQATAAMDSFVSALAPKAPAG